QDNCLASQRPPAISAAGREILTRLPLRLPTAKTMYNGRQAGWPGPCIVAGHQRVSDDWRGVMTVAQSWWSRGAVAAGLGILLSVAMLGEAKFATAQQRKKVNIVVATPVLNVTYSQLTLPITLGYWRDEGYDVELHTADGSLQAVQQLVGG